MKTQSQIAQSLVRELRSHMHHSQKMKIKRIFKVVKRPNILSISEDDIQRLKQLYNMFISPISILVHCLHCSLLLQEKLPLSPGYLLPILSL